MPDQSGQTHVLLIDDEVGIRWSIAAFLETRGFRVRTAADGARALAMVEEERPDLVILDMEMPIMSGEQFVRELLERNLHLPIIAMTAARRARSWAEQIGATAYVVKPVSFPLLLGRIDEIAASA